MSRDLPRREFMGSSTSETADGKMVGKDEICLKLENPSKESVNRTASKLSKISERSYRCAECPCGHRAIIPIHEDQEDPNRTVRMSYVEVIETEEFDALKSLSSVSFDHQPEVIYKVENLEDFSRGTRELFFSQSLLIHAALLCSERSGKPAMETITTYC